MKNLIYLFITLLFAYSCKKDTTKKPANFIEKDKMINLIIDMKIADKARMVTNIDKKKYNNYMAYVFEKYHIDSLQFKTSSDYYTEHLEQYKEIYVKVQKRLKDSVKKYEKIKKNNDSIAKTKKKAKLKLNKEIIKKAPINKIRKRKKVYANKH